MESFEELTGRGGLLNTSFNLHEEPIVCTPTDAIKALKEKRIDVLYIDAYRVVNREI